MPTFDTTTNINDEPVVTDGSMLNSFLVFVWCIWPILVRMKGVVQLSPNDNMNVLTDTLMLLIKTSATVTVYRGHRQTLLPARD